jgi:hypothetical protein
VIGEKINNMDLVLKNGLMVPVIRVTTSKVKSMARASLCGQMVAPLMEIFLTIILKAEVSTNGLMAEFLTENGKTIKCKDMGLSLGPMAGNMLANIMMI